MEAAYQNIRMKPIHDVQDSLVGTAADENALVIFRQQQINLMAEIIRNKAGICLKGKTEGMNRIFMGAGVTAQEHKAGKRFENILHRFQTGEDTECRVKADIFSGTVVMGFESIATEIDRGIGHKLKKTADSAAMVIVTMGEDSKIGGLQVNAHVGCIIDKGTALSHVEENIVSVGFNEETEPMFRDKIGGGCGIFHQYCNLHSNHLKKE